MMKVMKNIRIGNVEYRETKRLSGEGTYEEIILWYPNKLYGAKEKMKEEGWTETADGSMTKGNVTNNVSCFKREYSCYTVAIVEWNMAHDEFDVRSVGTRAFDLDKNDEKDFKKVLKTMNEIYFGEEM